MQRVPWVVTALAVMAMVMVVMAVVVVMAMAMVAMVLEEREVAAMVAMVEATRRVGAEGMAMLTEGAETQAAQASGMSYTQSMPRCSSHT